MAKIKFYPFSDKIVNFVEPPQPATKYVPEWYRKQPSQIDDANQLVRGIATSTIKKCMPVFDSMTAGYILAMPFDVFIDATNPDKLAYSIPASVKQFQGDLFASHSPEQFSEYPIDKDKYHKELIRITPFWAIGTEKGYSTLAIQPLHADSSPLYAFSGIVDTDTFTTDGHYSFLVEKNFKGIVKQGTPLVQVIPFKREAWTSEAATWAEAEKVFERQRYTVRSRFMHAYKNIFRAKKEYK